MSRVWIAFGSNQQDPIAQLLAAREALVARAEFIEEAASSLYLTPPWGYEAQPDFVNAVIRYRTEALPHTVLFILQAIEQAQHRVRSIKNGPRTLDLDILLYDHEEIASPVLSVPHPRMQERAFVMQPLAEINPDYRFASGKTAQEILATLDCTQQKSLSSAAWDNFKNR